MSVETIGAIYSLVKCCREREREIKELKKAASQMLLQSRAPMHLWDDGLELEVYIRTNTAHNIYKLTAEVPVMSGETSDISQFCKLEWFK